MKAISIIILLQSIFWLILLWKYRKASFQMPYLIVFYGLMILVSGIVYLEFIKLIDLHSVIVKYTVLIAMLFASPVMFRLSVPVNLKYRYLIFDAIYIVLGLAMFVIANRVLVLFDAIVPVLAALNLFYIAAALVLYVREVKKKDFMTPFYNEYRFRFTGLHILVWIISAILFVVLYYIEYPVAEYIAAAFVVVFAVNMFITGYICVSHFFNKWHKPDSKPIIKAHVDGILPEAVHNLMKNEKLFTDPDFNLEMLAEKLRISTFQASQLLNQTMKTSFSELLNTYRVEEVKKHLEAHDDRQYTLLAIAFESGFNSKSTFNRIFKDFTGFTPGEYGKKQQQK